MNAGPLNPELELRELISYGIVVGAPRQRPLLLLKGQVEGDVLPVALGPIETTLAVASHQGGPQGTSLQVALKILESQKIRVAACEFVEFQQGHQMVDLVLEGPGPQAQEQSRLRCRADEAMGICLSSKARFFATRRFMEQSRARPADQIEILLNLAGEGAARKRGTSVLLN